MRRNFFLLVFLLCSLNIAAQEDRDSLKELLENRSYPAWFQDAKLGIFIHWGIYSVPAYGGKESYAEWFLRGLQTEDSLRLNFVKNNYGPNFTYKDFAGEFKAELFDPAEWAGIFKKAGAKYVVLVSKHHDGFALWPSKYSRNWNTVDIGPKRDVVGELTEAVRETGLNMGLYYSLPEWNHPLHRWYTDPHDSISEYVESYMIPQFKELVRNYRPSLIFTDGEWYNSAEQWHSAELINWFYETIGEEAIVNNRWGHGIDVGFLTPEYSAGLKETKRPWAEVRGIGRSFGLNRNEDLSAYGTPGELIERFVQAVANGGGMILNVGPRADGQIPLIQQERLLQLGQWLEINGEAIYGSRPYKISEEEKPVVRTRIDDQINFNWVRNAPVKGIKEDDFSVEWNGFLVASESGSYELKLEVDDEARLFIGEKEIIRNNYTAPDNEAEVMDSKTGVAERGMINLKAGKAYPLKIQYREKKQNAQIKLYWSQKGKSPVLIPSDAFYQDSGKIKRGLTGKYTSQKTYISYTTNQDALYAISFEWPEEVLALHIPKPKEETSIKMLGLDRELEWWYKENTLFIDVSGIKYHELPSHEAWTFKIQDYE